MDFSFSFFIVNQVVVVACKGDCLGISKEEDLYCQISVLLKAGVSNCLLDFSEIRYLNSKGLSFLIRLMTLFRNHQGELILIQPNIKTNKLLAITKLDKVFRKTDSRTQGLAILSNS